jgi:hypothetical protein
MPTTTPNFGWSVPVSTDLVKDGATAIELLGDSIDASLVDLKGGTTGQVLAKASGTDMDFSWVAQDDSNAIQNAIVDAKGDLIAATAADTPARLAVGTNGQILTADSTASTGLAWTTPSSGGGMTSIASGSLSGSSLSLTSISGSYKNLQLIFRGATVNTDTEWRIRVNNLSTSIYSAVKLIGSASTGSTAATASQTSFNINNNWPNDGQPVSLVADFYDYTKTTSYKQVSNFLSYQRNNTDEENVLLQGNVRESNAIDRIDVILDAGSFTGGTYILYGVN